MKRCPQCNTVFEDDKVFCTQDGSSLVNETFSLPSDFVADLDDDGEQQTIIRKPQKRIKISKPKVAPQPDLPKVQAEVSQYAPNHDSIPPQTPQKQSGGCLKYSVILLVGLLIGSVIALGGVGFGYYYLNIMPNSENQTSSAEENTNKTDETKTEKNANEKIVGDHSKPNANRNNSNLNGQIIKTNAPLRSSPDSKAKQIDTLQKNDRIEIIKRRSSTSKWYEIECEHGSKGWIDGYSIKFTE